MLFVYLGGLWYSVLVCLLAIIGLYEFLRMAKIKPYGFAGLLGYLLMGSILWPYLFAAHPVDGTFADVLVPVLLLLLAYSVVRKNHFHIEHVALTILGAFYIGLGFSYMGDIRNAADGFSLTLMILLGIWSTDSGAYFVGRAIGKRKLWPAISPNKTVEGSIGGLVIALAVVIGVNAFTGLLAYPQAIGVGLVTGIAGQLGDLVESAIKRHFGVKDSGRIFPGHGGVLDRVDSWLFVFPLLHFMGLH